MTLRYYIEDVDQVKQRSKIDYKENDHGDAFINFLCDTNFAMLNGRFEDDFTSMSTKGKSIVDYMYSPYEELDSTLSWKQWWTWLMK